MLVLGLAVQLTEKQMRDTQMLVEDRVSLERYLTGTAEKPFAFRVLVPFLVRSIDRLVPEAAQREIGNQTFFSQTLPDILPPGASRFQYKSLALVLVLSLLAYAAIGWITCRRLFTPSVWFSQAVPVLYVATLIPFLTGGLGHIYDFAVLAFTAALLLCLLTGRHAAYLVLFAVSCLNKETTLLMTLAYAACYWDRLPRRFLGGMLLAQFAIFAAIQGTIRWVYAANDGEGIDLWWRFQLNWLTSRSFSECAAFLVILFLLAYRFDEKPEPVRRACILLVPQLVLFFVASWSGELRNLYEVVPLLMLLGCRNLELLAPYCFASASPPRSGIRR